MMNPAFEAVRHAARSYFGNDPSVALELRPLQEPGTRPRAIVEIRVQDAASRQQPLFLIGKCFPDESGARVFRNMTLLWQALTDREDETTLAVPALFAYDPSTCCLIQQKVPGVPLADVMDAPGCERHLASTGQALAELHGFTLSLDASCGLNEHMTDLIHPHPFELAGAWDRERRRILDLVAAISANLTRHGNGIRSVPLHRDLHPRQAFLDRPRVWMIDWDLLACGDAALDLGNFSMCLETRFGGNEGARKFEEFLSGYCATAGEEPLARVAVYRAFAYLRRAAKSYRIGGADWELRSAAMLDAAESALEAA